MIKGFPANFRDLKFESAEKLNLNLCSSNKLNVLFKDPRICGLIVNICDANEKGSQPSMYDSFLGTGSDFLDKHIFACAFMLHICFTPTSARAGKNC